MTHDELTSRYTLLEQLTAAGVRTFRARHSATQRPVMVHFIDDDAGDTQMQVIGSLEQLDRGDRESLLEMLDVDGATVIVTPVLDGFESFEGWLGSRTAARRPRPSAGSLTSVLEPQAAAPAPTPRPAPKSDYTMVVGAKAPPAPGPAPTPAIATAPRPSHADADARSGELARLEARLKSYMQMVMLLNLVVSVGVAFMLYFLLR